MQSNWLETLWGEILSRDSARIQAAFDLLQDEDERSAIVAHLRKMATEDGWSDPQRISAQQALEWIMPLMGSE